MLEDPHHSDLTNKTRIVGRGQGGGGGGGSAQGRPAFSFKTGTGGSLLDKLGEEEDSTAELEKVSFLSTLTFWGFRFDGKHA